MRYFYSFALKNYAEYSKKTTGAKDDKTSKVRSVRCGCKQGARLRRSRNCHSRQIECRQVLVYQFYGQSEQARKTSQEPGRTRLLNYFEINNGEYYFVDLPGYGYAKVNKQEKQKWGGLIENYLRTSKRLVNVFVLVDMRHEPTDDDKMLINYLYNYNIPFTIIATKADKLSRAQQQKCLAVIASALCVGTKDILVTSASAKTGKEGVLARIDMLLENAHSDENAHSVENASSNESAGSAENM